MAAWHDRLDRRATLVSVASSNQALCDVDTTLTDHLWRTAVSNTSRNDPYPHFQFRVEIDGIASSSFVEVCGLGLEIDVMDYREGAEPRRVRKLPGLSRYDQITLRRGFTGNLELWNWVRSIADGNLDRRNGVIILLSDSGQEVARWSFRSAWPVKWSGPCLDAESSEVSLETIVLVHEGLMLESG